MMTADPNLAVFQLRYKAGIKAGEYQFPVAAPRYVFCATLVILKPSSGVGAIKYFVTCSNISGVSVAALSGCSLRRCSICFKQTSFDRSMYTKLCGASISEKIPRNQSLCDRVFAGKSITTLVPADNID